MSPWDQLDLFDGETFDPLLDGERLRSQLNRVKLAMNDGDWWTLTDLADAAGGTEAAISARLRDLRKPKFGGRTVERRRVPGGRGLHEYRLLPI